MALRLEIISEHRDIVGDDAVREFNETGGTIGRSLQSDWILPDQDRYISGKHATIDFQGGAYYLADVSSNGVYMNGDCEPLGKGNPRRLFNGDLIRMGDFEITVSLDHGESLIMPPEEIESGLPKDNDHQFADDPLKTGILLLDEEEITGDDEFQSALFGDASDASSMQSLQDDSVVLDPEPDTASTADTGTAANATSKDLIDSFLDGVGINRAELHPSTDLAVLMQNAGEVLREFVEGATELLASRANLKNAFRLDQTTVLPRHNNPLKLSANSKDSIKQLLVGREGEYLGPRDAVREVCRDLLFHQDAFIDAMNNAFLEFADRFDPDELAEGFDRTMSSNPLARWFNKNKYWQLYCELYPIMTEKGGGRFPQMYAEEFVKAYERQIAEYKRLGGIANHLKATVKIDQSDLHAKTITEAVLIEPPQNDEFDDDDLDEVDKADRAEG